jgi:hypothetical protein
MYSRKLLIPGWAGQKSAAEKAYCKAHRVQSEAQAAHMRELAKHRFKKAKEKAA